MNTPKGPSVLDRWEADLKKMNCICGPGCVHYKMFCLIDLVENYCSSEMNQYNPDYIDAQKALDWEPKKEIK